MENSRSKGEPKIKDYVPGKFYLILAFDKEEPNSIAPIIFTNIDDAVRGVAVCYIQAEEEGHKDRNFALIEGENIAIHKAQRIGFSS